MQYCKHEKSNCLFL